MLYAKVVLGLPVDGPFDYIVPTGLRKKVNVGQRVWVSFRTKKMLGYIVQLTAKTNIKKLKPILEVIDEYPILDRNMLLLTKRLSDYYCCSWGEAIETSLPSALRKGKILPQSNQPQISTLKDSKTDIVLVHALDNQHKWEVYIKGIKEVVASNKSAIILLPDKTAVLNAKRIIVSQLDPVLSILYRNEPKELYEWERINSGDAKIVIGNRSGIFAPVRNLGLIIIDEEHNFAYKQDQVPHYHARVAAFMRSRIEKARLILGSSAPSLESFYSAKKNKIRYKFIPRENPYPEIRIIDTKNLSYQDRKRKAVFAKFLEDTIYSVLNNKGKTLLFLNRRGFATSIFCPHCGIIIKCPRCNINLVYHFQGAILKCHYCNFKMEPPKICPNCNSGYIKFSGTGTEKIESELSRIFAQAKIKRLDDTQQVDFKDADIFIATSAIFKQKEYNFDLVGVLGIDNALNHIDLRSSERTFALLVSLLGLTDKKMVIQTSLPNHYCFQALLKKDVNIFYTEELRQRKQLKFPPYKHIVLVKLRGRSEDKVSEVSKGLFDKLVKNNKDKKIEVISVNPCQPAKLRGNFYWQILIRAADPLRITKFLKINLKDLLHSGIIVTVDVDPL